VYHVIDAADFPMSLIPNLQQAFSLSPLRTQNRRAKHQKYVKGRIAEVSFIITRSDLLAPRKEQVDALMPYLTEVLRDALGRSNEKARLGNIKCVSAKRGWWTKDVKETIWKRGGGGWMVGKVNVGKSNLFEVVFPKGRNHHGPPNIDQIREEQHKHAVLTAAKQMFEQQSSKQSPADTADPKEQQTRQSSSTLTAKSDDDTNFKSEFDAITREEDWAENDEAAESDKGQPSVVENPPTESFVDNQIDTVDETDQIDDPNRALSEDQLDDFEGVSLLPPLQPEMMYPVMPIISSLPGTTAAPIRVPFGNGRGELIDLPGLQRTLLEDFVKPEHRKEIVMQQRISPPRIVLKPGQSLLLGGNLIRITPQLPENDPNLVFMVHPFVPLDAHVTSNGKAEEIQSGKRETGIRVIADASAQDRIASAGRFPLKWDVTRKQAGPLTRKDSVALKPEKLPFIVYSTDILIEGCGWVEITAQIRRRSFEESAHRVRNNPFLDPQQANPFPQVEVFSPEGKFIGQRIPMQAWLMGGQVPKPKSQRTQRPRQSIKSAKARLRSQPKTGAAPAS
jgi:genetic interactor of prohibitins 3, mitochondrial